MIRLLFIFLITVLYLIFVIYNMEDRIELNYVFGLSTQPLPVYILVLGSLLMGMLLAAILTLPGWIRTRMELRKQRRTIEQMEQELTRLAGMVSSTSDRPTQTFEEPVEDR